jgi:hypothetical protein
VTPEDIARCADAIETSIVARAQGQLDKVSIAFREWHAKFQSFLTTTDSRKFSSRQEAREFFVKEHPVEEFPALQALYEYCSHLGPKQIIEVVPADDTEAKVIDGFSMEFGDNVEFLTKVPSAKGWPLGPTELLGPECVFRGLHYEIMDSGESKRCELDVLATFGDAVILAECKAGGIRDAARRGGFPSVVSSMEDLVKNPCDQAVRAKRFIESTDAAAFFDEKGRPVTEVRRSRVNRFHLLTVILEQLWFLSANLQCLKTLGVLDGKTYPCAVSLADLVVMVEILARPSLFLHYLHQRVRLNEAPNLTTLDELDMMMEYVEHELWTEPSKIESQVQYIIGTQTPTLDAYYYGKELGKSVPKPQRKLHRGFASLLTAIERRPVDAGASCLCALLDCDSETQTKIGDWVAAGELQTRADGQTHSLSLGIDAGFALLLACDVQPWTSDRVRKWVEKWDSRPGVATIFVITWVVPLSSGIVHTWVFSPVVDRRAPPPAADARLG